MNTPPLPPPLPPARTAADRARAIAGVLAVGIASGILRDDPAPLIPTDADTLVDEPRHVLRKPRDIPSRELFAMAAAAREGIPPAGSPAAVQLRRLEESGSWTAARELRAEIARDASKLERLARARARQERRGKRRREHQQGSR